VLGGVSSPAITIKRALDLYWDLATDLTHGKSADQIRRWENPRKKAISNFISVVGNKLIEDITADDMLDFRSWCLKRIKTEGLTPNSCNKDLIHFGDVLKTVNQMKRLGLDLPLSGLAVKEGEPETRPPFSREWIAEKLLAPGALKGLNDEARRILLGMVNTGYRPSEAAGLTRDQIRLDAKVPHISIEPVDRTLKTAHSRRVIPLVGVSLEAFREAPDGFPRYRSKPASLSATVNKYLRENGLLETADHSLYSLRHSFEDRLLAAGTDERVRRDLLGHALHRERYGQGATLEHVQRLLQAVAL
jgi:integrase